MRFPIGNPDFGDRELELVTEVVKSGRLTQGPVVERFEHAFADRIGVKHAVACSSGTAALHLALSLCDLGPGDEVLVPDLTYVAVANAVCYTGATPILCDVNPSDWCIDMEDAAAKVTGRTKAIIPVHTYGIPCNMATVNSFANGHKLFVVEDAAEGLGGFFDGIPLGRCGDFGCYSFYANKIVSTGEGGMVVCEDDNAAELLRRFRGQGVDLSQGRWAHVEVGFNYRMGEMQAAVGLAQLERFSENIESRRRVMAFYRHALRHVLTPPPTRPSAPWLFTGLLSQELDRERFMTLCGDAGVETRPMFAPLHRMPMYRQPDAGFEISCILADAGVSLPTYASLTDLDQATVSGIVLRAAKESVIPGIDPHADLVRFIDAH